MLSRRRFLAGSGATLFSAPWVRSFSADEPKDKVRIAVIGIYDRGAANLAGVAKENIVALCEIDEARTAAARKQFPNAKLFTDFRKMLDTVHKEIDAVVVSTPDHTHAMPSILAMQLGKHVYCEKPLAKTVQEVRAMQAAAKKYKVITQMGTQIHAGENYRRVVEIIQSGAIGGVGRVHVWFAGKPPAMKKGPKTDSIKFDLDLWRGPVTDDFFYATGAGNKPWPHFNWRYWWSFGGGNLADMACHFMDLPFWALGLGAPKTISAKGTSLENADNTVPATLQVDYDIPVLGGTNSVKLSWYHGVSGPDLEGKKQYPGFTSGVLFEGSKGQLVADYNKLRLLPEEFARDFKAPDRTIAKSVGHHQEWLDAIRGNGKTLCHFGYSGTLTETVLLGNVAYRSGQTLNWDEASGTVTNTSAAKQYLAEPVRKGWEIV
jgi:predicted dehydrogenase